MWRRLRENDGTEAAAAPSRIDDRASEGDLLRLTLDRLHCP
jgi:hypothetical protein